MNHNFRRGFTLIELLLVIAIIAVLAIVVFAALNPVQRFKDSRDSRRYTDVASILTAIHEYIVDNRGALPSGLTAGMSETQIGSAGSGCAVTTGGCNVAASACVNLTTPLAAYLASIPVDPSLASDSAETNYSVVVNSNGIVTIRACGVEGSTNISSSR
jgi:prepilin-type N-terminal cleavage/methylation domain-containing protein